MWHATDFCVKLTYFTASNFSTLAVRLQWHLSRDCEGCIQHVLQWNERREARSKGLVCRLGAHCDWRGEDRGVPPAFPSWAAHLTQGRCCKQLCPWTLHRCDMLSLTLSHFLENRKCFLQFKMQYIELSTIIIGVWKPYLEFWCIANA